MTVPDDGAALRQAHQREISAARRIVRHVTRASSSPHLALLTTIADRHPEVGHATRDWLADLTDLIRTHDRARAALTTLTVETP